MTVRNGKSRNPGILQHSVTFYYRHIRAKFGIPNSPQSQNIGQNADGYFWISGQPIINGNSHNSRTIHDINMSLGPVTKLDKGNTATSKKNGP